MTGVPIKRRNLEADTLVGRMPCNMKMAIYKLRIKSWYTLPLQSMEGTDHAYILILDF